LLRRVVLYSAKPEMANFTLNFLPYRDDKLNKSVVRINS